MTFDDNILDILLQISDGEKTCYVSGHDDCFMLASILNRILFIVDPFNSCLMNPQHPDHQKMQTMVLVNTCHDKLLVCRICYSRNN